MSLTLLVQFSSSLQKNIIYLKCNHHQDIDDFAFSLICSSKILRNLALNHLLTNGSSAVNGCRQNKGLCTLSPKFSHACFRIHNPKNSSRTETLHIESDTY